MTLQQIHVLLRSDSACGYVSELVDKTPPNYKEETRYLKNLLLADPLDHLPVSNTCFDSIFDGYLVVYDAVEVQPNELEAL